MREWERICPSLNWMQSTAILIVFIIHYKTVNSNIKHQIILFCSKLSSFSSLVFCLLKICPYIFIQIFYPNVYASPFSVKCSVKLNLWLSWDYIKLSLTFLYQNLDNSEYVTQVTLETGGKIITQEVAFRSITVIKTCWHFAECEVSCVCLWTQKFCSDNANCLFRIKKKIASGNIREIPVSTRSYWKRIINK